MRGHGLKNKHDSDGPANSLGVLPFFTSDIFEERRNGRLSGDGGGWKKRGSKKVAGEKGFRNRSDRFDLRSNPNSRQQTVTYYYSVCTSRTDIVRIQSLVSLKLLHYMYYGYQ